MLPETASSIENRPLVRTAIRQTPPEDIPANTELRQAVLSVFAIDRERYPRLEDDDRAGDFPLLLLGEDSRLAATYEGTLLYPSEEAYEKLDQQLVDLDHLALFREADGKHVIHLVRGRPKPKPRSWHINALLLIATFFSVLIVGTTIAMGEISLTDPQQAEAIEANLLMELWRGLPYAISILLILGAHELGHYFAARKHKLETTLPYFIPAPLISPLGTFGAFIQLREPIRNKKILMDVGAAGPLAGLVFAIPILAIGLATSIVSPITPGTTVEGNSLLYAVTKTIVFGRFLPDGQVDVLVNQLAWAGWTGLLVTALNLIPIGQLDGGHILFALIGNLARRLYYPLIGTMVALTFLVSEVWFFWLILLFLFGRVYATPLDMITPLDQRRRWIGVLCLIVFLVTFTPVPFTIAEGGGTSSIRESVQFMLPAAVGLITLTLRRRFSR